MTKVSVIVPTYNSAEYIKETLLSILNEGYENIEIVVVDDASTDNTAEVVGSLGSGKIRYFRLSEHHGGPSRARNVGVSASRGEYIALCDSDDIVLHGRIGNAVTMLEKNPDLGLVFSDAIKFDDNCCRLLGTYLNGYDVFMNQPKTSVGGDRYMISSSHAYSTLFYENYIITSGVTLPKTVLERVGAFDETLTNGDDRDMWFRITREFPIGFTSTPCLIYQVRHGSISDRGAMLAYNRIKVLRKQLEHELPSELATQVHRLVAMNLNSIGYYHQSHRNKKEARKFYLKSLCEKINLSAIRGFLISFIWFKLLDIFELFQL